MIVTAWNNGSYHESGAGYGLKIQVSDRDNFFDENWKFILLELENHPELVSVNIDKSSFWGANCRELISKEIGLWLRSINLAPWPKGKPPKLLMNNVSENIFYVKSGEHQDAS